MVRLSHERVLLVGDTDHHVESALAHAVPDAKVTSVASWFDAIAELSAGSYTTVLAAAEPVERRPESAVRTVRQLNSEGRLYLFGHPTLEPLSQKMMEFGCDDYLVTPANPTELQQMFGVSAVASELDDTLSEDGPIAPVKTTKATLGAHHGSSPDAHDNRATRRPAPGRLDTLASLPVSDLLLDAMLLHPGEPVIEAVRKINAMIAPHFKLAYLAPAVHGEITTGETQSITHVVRHGTTDAGVLQLTLPRDEDLTAARHVLAQLSTSFGKVAALQARHIRLQKLAITDDLTGVSNYRYFRHFLKRILEDAQARQLPVTLLMFDIDNFKQYNDRYGHGVGDEILKQTAQLMRRCCRDHDLVARIGGDEFVVVFWEKDGPRQPHDPKAGTPGRPPQTPLQILERFRHQIASPDFSGLGASGRGTLTISAGLANFPWNARTADELIKAADDAVVFGAKQSGKNSVVLVGGENHGKPGNTDTPTV